MVKSARKTHAMRVLEAADIGYTATTYDPSGTFHTAEEAAALLGQPPEAIYKSLIVLSETDSRRKPILVMIPSDAHLDLKRLAAAMEDKKLRMATQREAENLTGMQVGGISALGLLRPGGFEVLIDERAFSLDTIHVSAGERGIDLALRPAGLITATNARSVALA